MAMLAGLLAAPGAAAPAPAPAVPCPPRGPQVFISPMGEPFRAAAGERASPAAWFAAADSNRDGRLTLAEFVADADRFFTRLDRDGNGELAPAEIADYENRVAPEIRLYQLGAWPGAGPIVRKRDMRRKSDDYGGELGAGRFTWLNIPEPVASADLDMNRGVSRAEFQSVAATRFRLLDKAGAKALTLAALPPLPADLVPCPSAGDKKPRR